MAVTAVPGKAQPGFLQPGARQETDVAGELRFVGKSRSVGSIRFSRPTRTLSFKGKSGSVGSIGSLILYTYITPLEAPSSMSVSIREVTPTTPDALSQSLRVNNTASAKIYALLDIDIPATIGVGAQVLRADLYLYKAAAWSSGSKTLTVHSITSAWDAETVTYNTAPTVGSSVSETEAGVGAAADLVEVNVTSLIQAAVAARDAGTDGFYGFRLSTTSTDDLTFMSAYATPDYRPVLKVETSLPPNAPEDLLPNGGRAVSETKPLLDSRFFDADAEDTVSAGEWEIDTTDDFETPVYDSGEINVTSAQFDLASPPAGAPATPTLSTATTYYWRNRLRDNHGLWSDWGSAAEFQVITKGTLALTAPATSTVASPTPTFTWSFTPAGAETQQSIELEVEILRDGLWRSHYLYKRTVTAVTSIVLPDAYALEEGESYRVYVRLWDSVDREDMAGDRAFLEDSQEFTLTGLVI